ncbi:MAG TPA: electron transport complex subunit RsxD [Gammaproteobacteria bacterium]|nr:electron transport complex subunit RsxD [Gammaproteobacteria bacterium]
MRFATAAPPHYPARTSIALTMRRVLYALVPAAIAHVWYFGSGLLINMLVAAVVAVACEAAVLRLRRRPILPYLTDWSAVLAAVLLAFALPPLTPWWATAIGAMFAIVFAKHLFGGIGFNPFNPAMAGYAVLLIAFPAELNHWLPPRGIDSGLDPVGVGDTLWYVFTGRLPAGLDIDAVTTATPLDAVKTGIGQARTVAEVRAGAVFGDFAGRGWVWINSWFALGGIWLLYKSVIRWHIPVSMLAGLAAMAGFFWILDPGNHAAPGFHLFSGAAMIGAFFIATDPVTAATTVRGRLIYGASIGVLTYLIRAWGGYPDGVAFAVLIMNLCVPVIDHFTRPRVYGHGRH